MRFKTVLVGGPARPGSDLFPHGPRLVLQSNFPEFVGVNPLKDQVRRDHDSPRRFRLGEKNEVLVRFLAQVFCPA